MLACALLRFFARARGDSEREGVYNRSRRSFAPAAALSGRFLPPAESRSCCPQIRPADSMLSFYRTPLPTAAAAGSVLLICGIAAFFALFDALSRAAATARST